MRDTRGDFPAPKFRVDMEFVGLLDVLKGWLFAVVEAIDFMRNSDVNGGLDDFHVDKNDERDVVQANVGMKSMSSDPRVVIVGAGFGGLWAARHVAPFGVKVLLIDRNNYHTFFPLLYQVAAAEVGAGEIAYPVRTILRGLRNVEFELAEVKEIDLDRRLLMTGNRSVSYDYLILAVGSVPQYFGIPGAHEYALPLKALEDSIAIRNRILSSFERAAHERDRTRREMNLTFVIVGGGPTGVEFAGALLELIHGALMKDFGSLDFREVHVVLLEALAKPLSGFPERLQNHVVKRLTKMGVDLRLSTPVAKIGPDAVYLKDGTVISTETVIWTAGVRGNPEAKTMGLPAIRNGHVPVLPTLQIDGHPEVYVVGDLAYFEEKGRPLPMIASVAIQQGTQAARNVVRQIAGLSPENFTYTDRGYMATLGRNSGVAYLLGHCFFGFPAWLIWLGVHLYNLIGFRNRLFVLIDWAWDYFFYERTVRLILSN